MCIVKCDGFKITKNPFGNHIKIFFFSFVLAMKLNSLRPHVYSPLSKQQYYLTFVQSVAKFSNVDGGHVALAST
jgi:hypothetical protein